MKRRIVAAFPASRSKKELELLRKDRKALINCETMEDVEAIEWDYYNVTRSIKRAMDRGDTFEESVDAMLDSMNEAIKKLKQDIIDYNNYQLKKVEVVQLLHALSDKYQLIDSDETSLTFMPPEGATHADCIQFVDDVVNLVNGKYVFTGRGGSWTRWDLKSDSGVQLKAGWKGNGLWSVSV